MKEIQKKINNLGPWIFSYQRDDGEKIEMVTIKEHNAEHKFKDFMQKKYYLREIDGMVNVLFKDLDLSKLRAIDLGCQEGQFSDILCKKKFKEVVSIDLSEEYVNKANFLLKEFKGYNNSTVLQGNILDLHKMSKLGKFNIVIAKAIFYHMKDPIVLFDLFELLRPKEGSPFYVILDQRYKTNNLNFLISDHGLAEVVKSDFSDESNFKSYEIIKTKQGSVFDRARMRMNPQSIFYLTRRYGYFGTIEYDIGNWSATVLCSRLLLVKEVNNDLVQQLTVEFKDMDGFFKIWNGKSISGLDFRNSLLVRFMNSNFIKRVSYYFNSFFLTSIKYRIALKSNIYVQERFYDELDLGAKNNKSIFEKFKFLYFGRKIRKKIHNKKRFS